jgi:hypothetical protein
MPIQESLHRPALLGTLSFSFDDRPRHGEIELFPFSTGNSRRQARSYSGRRAVTQDAAFQLPAAQGLVSEVVLAADIGTLQNDLLMLHNRRDLLRSVAIPSYLAVLFSTRVKTQTHPILSV